MRNILSQIKNIKWQYCINRKEPLLFRSLSHASHWYLKGVKGMPWQEEYSLHFDRGDFFISPDDFKKFSSTFSDGGA